MKPLVLLLLASAATVFAQGQPPVRPGESGDGHLSHLSDSSPLQPTPSSDTLKFRPEASGHVFSLFAFYYFPIFHADKTRSIAVHNSDFCERIIRLWETKQTAALLSRLRGGGPRRMKGGICGPSVNSQL
jgi:hypothetical protein